MKKILCIIIAAMMIASVSVNAVEVDEEVNDVEVVETVEDMPDEDVAEVADVDEPEDTPDEAPADLEDLPDLEDPVIDEPEDYPDADPDDEIAPVVLAATNYKVNTIYDYDDNIQWWYKDGVLEFKLKEGATDGVIHMGGYDGWLIDSWLAPWEELITNNTLGNRHTDDDLPLTKIIIHEGITELPKMGFNILHGNITLELPSTLKTIKEGCFGGLFDSSKIYCTVNFHGSLQQWEEEVTIESKNSAVSLGTTEYFNMYIPDVIELDNINNSWKDKIIYQSNISGINTYIQFNGGENYDGEYKDGTMTCAHTVDSGTNNIINGSDNKCAFTATVTDSGSNNKYTGKCTITVTPVNDKDYQDYSCSATLTFNFKR